MECPKCEAPNATAATECARCGVIFAKLQMRVSPAGPPDEAIVVPGRVPRFVPSADPLARAARVLKGAAVAGLAIWTWHFARAPMGTAAMESFLHMPNLVFHEAGHVLFSPFGRFMAVLGGSLLQLLVPLVLAGALLKQRDQFGGALCSWWAGQNLLDLAPYIADARALQLVLLGGKTGAEVEGHDWEYILTEFGWLHRDYTLGLAAHRAGLLIMCAAIMWAATRVLAPPPADRGEPPL